MSGKEKARTFMFVCIGILALVMSFNFGASKAQGGSTGRFVSVTSYAVVYSNGSTTRVTEAITDNGDYYRKAEEQPWVFWANISQQAGDPTGPRPMEPQGQN